MMCTYVVTLVLRGDTCLIDLPWNFELPVKDVQQMKQVHWPLLKTDIVYQGTHINH